MAISRIWTNSSPTGGEPAATLDTIIKNIKQDISERMEFLVDQTHQSWESSTVGDTLKTNLASPNGEIASAYRSIGWADATYGTITPASDYVTGATIIVPIRIPSKATILDLYLELDRNAATTTVKLDTSNWQAISGPRSTDTLLTWTVNTGTGKTIYPYGTLSVTVGYANSLFLRITGDAAQKFYGLWVYYSVPSFNGYI